MIVSSGETKIFEKKLKKGVTKQGGNLDSQWCRGDVFFRFFRKTTAQLGQILEITPVEGRFGEFGELAHRVLLKCRCPVCQRMP